MTMDIVVNAAVVFVSSIIGYASLHRKIDKLQSTFDGKALERAELTVRVVMTEKVIDDHETRIGKLEGQHAA